MDKDNLKDTSGKTFSEEELKVNQMYSQGIADLCDEFSRIKKENSTLIAENNLLKKQLSDLHKENDTMLFVLGFLVCDKFKESGESSVEEVFTKLFDENYGDLLDILFKECNHG